MRQHEERTLENLIKKKGSVKSRQIEGGKIVRRIK